VVFADLIQLDTNNVGLSEVSAESTLAIVYMNHADLQFIGCSTFLARVTGARQCSETPPGGAHQLTMKLQRQTSETRDMPFLKNDMNDAPPTTGKPLDAADAPGKADSEMFEADEILPPLDISP